ncbi:hypothetical protein QFC21_006721 [Naganishia friedmannii]|uniref:Uncharacterized protein n=1 Tax=Naganishia friedmannii TaxID=89922 RepID=A0ACC2V208_9TREE|nr:hypothetical protein QFC21_006721 [Naganishia friedmannii]
MYQVLPDAKPDQGQQDLDEEPSTLLDRQNPLRPSRDNTGRLAGTQRRKDLLIPRITVDRYRDDPSLGNGKDWSGEEWIHVKDVLLKVEAEGKEQDEALKALLDRPNVVLSIRKVKALIRNWRLEYPLVSSLCVITSELTYSFYSSMVPLDTSYRRSAASAIRSQYLFRYVCSSVSEDDIKNQNWAGKEKPKDKQHDAKSAADLLLSRTLPATRTRAGMAANEVCQLAYIRRRIGDAAEEGRKVHCRKEAEEAMEIQIDDQFTPDNWIPRSNHLIRLAGKHPMNAEVDSAELYDAGFITPTKLHYVRSHGAVPRLSWGKHVLEVFSDPPGMLDAVELSMNQLASDHPSIEIPVTIACDGIRRGEVNLVKRSAACLRSIFPTHVGGRQVKWVKKMWISKAENSSHYHIYDNRVLPAFITDGHSMLAKAFRHHLDTAYMERNLNSVICRPAHNQLIPLGRE